MNTQALAFDTGGTALDWHGGLVRALSGVGSQHGIERDWHRPDARSDFVPALAPNRRRPNRACDFIEEGVDGLRDCVLATS